MKAQTKLKDAYDFLLEGYGNQTKFTKLEVIRILRAYDKVMENKTEKLIDDILEYPDQVIDAVSNEYTDWDAKKLIELAQDEIDIEQCVKCGAPLKSHEIKRGTCYECEEQ